MFRKSKHAIFDSKKCGTTGFLQKNFISLFFVCTTCIPADVQIIVQVMVVIFKKLI